MLTHPTLDQLRALKLDGMAQAFVDLEAQEEVRNLTHAEWLALLLDRELANRNTRRFQTRLRAAHRYERSWSAAGWVQDAAANLILFDRFEQGLEVAFTETVIALSLDKLEEDGPDCRTAKALQQDLCEASFHHPFAVD